MDFHSISDPYIPAWMKAQLHGTESLFEGGDCFSSMNLPMGNQQNELFAENVAENSNQNLVDFNMNTIPTRTNGLAPVTEELLWPVAPLERGEGSPYAPVDWPNPGDIWRWRVGRRVNNAGYFLDRFLCPPKHLIPIGGGQNRFSSKTAVETFVKTYFPGADVGAFFASFSWKIPAKIQTTNKVETVPVQLEEAPQHKTEAIQEDTEKPTHRYSRRERKLKIEKFDLEEEDEEEWAENAKALHSSGRKRKQKAAKVSSTPKRKAREPFRHSSRSTANHVEEQLEAIVNLIPEDFDDYLNSLEDILAEPLPEVLNSNTSLFGISLLDNEMVKARNKLSSLLLKDLPSLISSKNFTQLTTLASKLRKDPTLTADQLVKLKLIDELPLFGEVYCENRQTINHVHNFFSTLETNKAKVAFLKNEYSVLKEKADQLQSQLDSSAFAIQEIDDQMAELEAYRAEFMRAAETGKAAKVEVSFAQRMVASSIPNVVHEIQLAISRIPQMKLERTHAEKREAEIVEKLFPLQGYSF